MSHRAIASDEMSSDDAAVSADEMLAAAYALDGPDANRALYAQWAATYESGFVAGRRYIYPEQVADVFSTHRLDLVGPGDVVVDIGCGTGLAGEALRHHRPITIDGLDISPEMLQHAATKRHGDEPVYRSLIEADLTRPLEIADSTYAGALSAGTFTHGHVGPDALAEIIRIVRPGGRAALGINAAHFAAAGFGVALDQLAGEGRITDLELIDKPMYEAADLDDPDQVTRIATFIVT
jgi:SAM-dependent methyltransferase